MQTISCYMHICDISFVCCSKLNSCYSEKMLKEDPYLVPYSMLELALMYMDQARYKEARSILSKAKFVKLPLIYIVLVLVFIYKNAKSIDSKIFLSTNM